MSENKSTSLTTREPRAVVEPESTHAGVLISPAVDICESPEAIIVLADMPGVAANGLDIDLNEGVLTITGPVRTPEDPKEEVVGREFGYGTFQRKFTLSESIDQQRIDARLTDGVLRLTLPKVDRAIAKKIEIQTS